MELAVRERGLSPSIVVDSAGTHARSGYPPEPLAIAVAADYGVDISQQRSRVVCADDYGTFDHLIALDSTHLEYLRFMRPSIGTAKIDLLLSRMAGSGDAEVPDPFGRDRRDFEYAARLIEIGIRRLLERVQAAEI